MAYVPLQFQKYPSMERQDLTQSQLGSFKFTPVDNSPQASQSLAHGWRKTRAQQRLEQQLRASVKIVLATQLETSTQQPAKLPNTNTPQSHSPTRPRASTCSPPYYSFFNEHIKPDLGESRLKFGTAAIRLAVESQSPKKGREASKTNLDVPSSIASNHQQGLSEMNPIASAFVPSAPTFNPTFEDNAMTAQAVVRALVAEQQAHSLTKISLQESAEKVQDLEAENKKMSKQIKSLVEAVNMLGSIIKHNEKNMKPFGSPVSHKKASRVQKEEIEIGEELQPQPIVYDVLARQREEYREQQSPTPTDSDSVAETATIKQVNSQTELTEDASLQTQNQNCANNTSEGLPLHIIPEKVKSFAREAFALAKDYTAPFDMDKTPTTPSHSAAPVKLGEVERASTEAPVFKMADKPTLQLPPSFLAKYRPQGSQARTMVTSAENKSSTATHDDKNKGFQNAANRTESQPTSLNLSTTASDALVPVKLNIKWKVTPENQIYDTFEELKAAQTINGAGGQKGSQAFWRYPVRYIEYAEKNLYRTVMIDYIPLGSTYSDVLSQICSGAIERIELYGPIGKATNFMTARIVFHYELAARTTVKYAADHTMKIRGKQVRVWGVITQTYPKNRQLARDVFENMYTRLLLVNLKNGSASQEVEDQMRATLPKELAWLKSSIVEISKTRDGFDLVEFTSVAAATEAMKQLATDPAFGGIEMDFDDDPCAEPYPFGG